MSRVGRRFYVNEVTVRNFIEMLPNGKARYGDPFKIKCYFDKRAEVVSNADGVDIVSFMFYMTEYPNIKELDLVGGRVVKATEMYNSTSIGQTVMDYAIWT